MRVLPGRLLGWCVYWAPLDKDLSGQATFSAPVGIKCRWVDTTQSFLDRSGNTAISKAIVYVNQTIIELGALMELTQATRQWLQADADAAIAGLTTDQKNNPFSNLKAWEIRKFERFPGLSYTQYQYKAFL